MARAEYGPTERALEATGNVCSDRELAGLILEEAHSPALGLDRSVPAREVWNWLMNVAGPDYGTEFEREFGGSRVSGQETGLSTDWMPGDPCGVCGSRNTGWGDPTEGAVCLDCGATDGDDT